VRGEARDAARAPVRSDGAGAAAMQGGAELPTLLSRTQVPKVLSGGEGLILLAWSTLRIACGSIRRVTVRTPPR